jgi:hypothetical protein
MTLESDLVKRIVAIERRLAEIEARERAGSVVAIYYSNAAQTIPNSAATIINYNVMEVDTNSAVTTGSSWKFTAPVGGYYHIDAKILFAGTTTWADGEVGEFNLYVNGTARANLNRKDNYGSSSSLLMGLGGSTIVYLNSGDYVHTAVIQTSGGSLTIYSNGFYNRIAVVRV